MNGTLGCEVGAIDAHWDFSGIYSASNNFTCRHDQEIENLLDILPTWWMNIKESE
jgi:hypothetical protein